MRYEHHKVGEGMDKEDAKIGPKSAAYLGPMSRRKIEKTIEKLHANAWPQGTYREGYECLSRVYKNYLELEKRYLKLKTKDDGRQEFIDKLTEIANSGHVAHSKDTHVAVFMKVDDWREFVQ